MMEIACTCDDLPPHTHVYAPVEELTEGVRMMVMKPTGEVRIWVDWKAVARELSLSP